MVRNIIFIRFDVNDHYIGCPVFFHHTNEFFDFAPIGEIDFHIAIHIESRFIRVIIESRIIKKTRSRDKIQRNHKKKGYCGYWKSSNSTSSARLLPFSFEPFRGFQDCVNCFLGIEVFYPCRDIN